MMMFDPDYRAGPSWCKILEPYIAVPGSFDGRFRIIVLCVVDSVQQEK
jgi:hypothetical protein